MAVLPTGIGPVTGGYQIERSLRFNSADSAYLNRTPATTTNRRTFTFSTWLKLGFTDTAERTIFASRDDNTAAGNFLAIAVWQNQLRIVEYSSGYKINLIPTQVMRDVSAWYHLVVAIDTTQATDTNRVKVYLNGSQITAFGTATYPSQNTDLYMNVASQPLSVGARHQGSGQVYYFGGYLTEVNFIDGQALTPSDFGETDSNTGVWKPKTYTGTYGTNGFYLNFSDNSNTTAATLGKDYSGNGNNWTPNNFSVTAGAGNDSLVDSPTSYGTDTGVGGEVRGNYCTMNPINATSAAGTSLSNGNLQINGYGTGGINAWIGTLGVSSGKWYYEVTMGELNGLVGISKTGNPNTYPGGDSTSYSYTSGNKYNNGASTAYGAALTGGDVVGVAYNLDAGTITFYKNGASQGQAFSGLSGNYFPAIRSGTTGAVVSVNFGQRAFAYTAPSGFKALCTQNLPTPTIGATSTTQANDYFNVALYTGDGANPRTVSGVGFQPDFVWFKSRSVGYYHQLFDAVRGTTKALYSNVTDAEVTNNANGALTAFNSDGFTLGGTSSTSDVNGSGITFVSWNWNAGGSTVTNTSGTISAQVRANTTSGFSVVTYTGTGANATVGHGLGVAPDMIIVKNRTNAGQFWAVGHTSLTSWANGVYLNSTAGQASATTLFNSTTPTSTVFSVGTSGDTNGSTHNMVAYCFDAVAGYSAFGSYVGNGSADGPFTYTGFRPRYVIVKRTDSTGDWYVYDTARNPSNLVTQNIFADLAAAESTYAAPNPVIDILSNGFKQRGTYPHNNASGGTYIYAAFAEHPFKYSLAR